MSKHDAAYHTGHAECGCGEQHTSVLASIYCAEQMETEALAARRPPRVKKPSNIVKSID